MVFMKVREKMKIGIFQPNINNYPSIDSKLKKLEEILNQHDLDLLVLPELFLSFYLSKELIAQYTNEDVQLFKQKVLQISEKFQCHLVYGYPEFENNQKFVQESLTGFNDSFFYGLPIFLELKDYVHVQSSGLQLTKSPGQFWVYLGSILLVLGIFCMIYIQEVRLWILKKKNNKNVLLALATNRHRYEFDQFAKKVSQQIRKILN